MKRRGLFPNNPIIRKSIHPFLNFALYIRRIRRKFGSSTEKRMRNAMPFLAVVALAAVFTSGCAGPEQKLGRGMSNLFEVVRMGEMRRSVEQTAIFDSPGAGYTVGVVHGFDRSVARTAWACLKSSLSRCRRTSRCSPATSSPTPFSRRATSRG